MPSTPSTPTAAYGPGTAAPSSCLAGPKKKSSASRCRWFLRSRSRRPRRPSSASLPAATR